MTTLVLAILLVIVATWPLLKFSTMRLTERVPRNAGLYYALSATATIVMLIVLMIDLRYEFFDPETDTNLKNLELAIDRNLGQELTQALRALNGIANSPDLKNEKFKDHTKDSSAGCTAQQKPSTSHVNTCCNVLECNWRNIPISVASLLMTAQRLSRCIGLWTKRRRRVCESVIGPTPTTRSEISCGI